MNDEELEKRLSNISWRWTSGRASIFMVSRNWRKAINPANGLVPFLLFFLIARTFLDLAAWWGVKYSSLPLGALSQVRASAVLSSLLLLWMVNAWIVDRSVERDVRSARLPTWKRSLRILVAGAPLLSFYVMQLSCRGDVWTHPVKSSGRPLDLSQGEDAGGGGAGSWRWIRRLENSVLPLIWLLVPNACFLVLVAFWFVASLQTDARHLLQLWALVAAVLSFLAMKGCQNLWPFRAGARRMASVFPHAFLLPMPMPLLFVAMMIRAKWTLSDLDGRQGLVSRIFGRWSGLGQSPAWVEHRDFLLARREIKRWHWPWQRPEEFDRSVLVEQLASLCRLKCLTTAVDAVCLGMVWAWQSRGIPGLEAVFERDLNRLSIVLLNSGCCALLLPLVAWLGLRVGPEGRSWWKDSGIYSAVVQFSLAVGLAIGFYFEAGTADQLRDMAGEVVLLLVPLPLLVSVSPFVRKIWPSVPARKTLWLWSGLLAALGILGAALAHERAHPGPITTCFRTVALLAPVWNLGLALLFLKDFLRPFRLREALQLRPRWRMAILLFTLAAPLGGLAIPLWIWARQRWWPGWERGWSPGDPGAGDLMPVLVPGRGELEANSREF